MLLPVTQYGQGAPARLGTVSKVRRGVDGVAVSSDAASLQANGGHNAQRYYLWRSYRITGGGIIGMPRRRDIENRL